MKIDAPTPELIPQLKQLWKLAFQEEEGFVQLFFREGFAPERCRCILREGRVLAALYWFDCTVEERPFAYIYGVATHPVARGQGLCRRLMADTHRHLTDLGYEGVLLVPQKESLRGMYAGFGYQEATSMGEFFCAAELEPVPIHAIDHLEYGQLRRKYLPEGSVIQEGVSLPFLAGYAKFFKGMDFLLCAAEDGDSLMGLELLGNREVAPGILGALGFGQGTFRGPGDKKPFAMFLPLKEGVCAPRYFGLAFD